jgi:hypothetical protein
VPGRNLFGESPETAAELLEGSFVRVRDGEPWDTALVALEEFTVLP